MVTRTAPCPDSETVTSGPLAGCAFDVTPSTEFESLPGTPLPDAEAHCMKTSPSLDTPLKKSFFKPLARFQISESKSRSMLVKPEENRDRNIQQNSNMNNTSSTVSMENAQLACESVPPCDSEVTVEKMVRCDDPVAFFMETTTPTEGSNDNLISKIEDVFRRSETCSTSASSGLDVVTLTDYTSALPEGCSISSSSRFSSGGASQSSSSRSNTTTTPSSIGSSDDNGDATFNALNPKLSNLVETSPQSRVTSSSRELVDVVQGCWRTARDTEVIISGDLALWMRESMVKSGGNICEVAGQLQLFLSDGCIYTAELNESETTLKWSDGDVWKRDRHTEASPTLVIPKLSESFAEVLNAQHQEMHPGRRADREPSLPATLSQQKLVSLTQGKIKYPRSFQKTNIANYSLSPQDSCEDISSVSLFMQVN